MFTLTYNNYCILKQLENTWPSIQRISLDPAEEISDHVILDDCNISLLYEWDIPVHFVITERKSLRKVQAKEVVAFQYIKAIQSESSSSRYSSALLNVLIMSGKQNKKEARQKYIKLSFVAEPGILNL